MMKPDQERVKNLLTDTITLLCRNGLQFKKEIKVQGLLGITLDESEVFLVQIDERIGGLFAEPSDTSQTQQHAGYNAEKLPARPRERLVRSRFKFRQAALQKRRYKGSSVADVKLAMTGANCRQNQSNIVDSEVCSQSDALNDQLNADDSNVEENSEEWNALVKKEEQDDDVIFVDHDRDLKIHSDDCAAMMDSYALEVTGNEAHLAKNIFSQFSSLSDALGKGGDETDVKNDAAGELINDTFVGSNQLMNRGESLNYLSVPGDVMQWDVGGASQSFVDSQTSTALPFHSSVSSDLKKSRCSICGKWYATHATLQRHMDAMHGTKRYSCDVDGCTMLFKYQHRLREHQRLAHPQQYSLDS